MTEDISLKNEIKVPEGQYRRIGLVKLFFWSILGFLPYWYYAQWSHFAKVNKEKNISPFWRTWFSIFYIWPLFRSIKSRTFSLAAFILYWVSYLSKLSTVRDNFEISDSLDILFYLAYVIFIVLIVLFQKQINDKYKEANNLSNPIQYFGDKKIKFGWGIYVVHILCIVGFLAVINSFS